MIKKNIAFCRLLPVGRLSSFPMHGSSTSFSCIETSVYWHSFVSLLFSSNYVLAAKQTVTTSSLSLKKALHLLFLLTAHCTLNSTAQHTTTFNTQQFYLIYLHHRNRNQFFQWLLLLVVGICVCSSILILFCMFFNLNCCCIFDPIVLELFHWVFFTNMTFSYNLIGHGRPI